MEMVNFRIFAASVFLLLFLSVACYKSHGADKISIDSEYYPLALHNSWKYRVNTLFPKKSQSYVTWKVTRINTSKNGPIYQVVPFPSSADDEFMELLVLPEGIKESSSGASIMKFPLRKGSVWSTENKRTFRIESLGNPCEINSHSYKDCLAIEDDDPNAPDGVRTVTIYVRHIGPVAYRYYREISGKATLYQTVELESYQLN
jgi:hypothetical protein